VNSVHITLFTRHTYQRAIRSETSASFICGRNRQKINEQKTTNKVEDGREKFGKNDK